MIDHRTVAIFLVTILVACAAARWWHFHGAPSE